MSQKRRTTKSVKLVESTHGRLKEHKREGETLSGAIDRALDALESDDVDPETVREAARDGAREAIRGEA